MVRQHVVGYHWLEESVVVVHLISIIDDRAGYNEIAAAARGIEGEGLVWKLFVLYWFSGAREDTVFGAFNNRSVALRATEASTSTIKIPPHSCPNGSDPCQSVGIHIQAISTWFQTILDVRGQLVFGQHRHPRSRHAFIAAIARTYGRQHRNRKRCKWSDQCNESIGHKSQNWHAPTTSILNPTFDRALQQQTRCEGRHANNTDCRRMASTSTQCVYVGLHSGLPRTHANQSTNYTLVA